MTNESNEQPSDDLVFRALVPKGFRPTTDTEIEQMLDGLGPAEISQSKLQRMLGKIKGTIPKAWEETLEATVRCEADSADARELAELYRARGEIVPPEIQAKLRELEKRASETDPRNEGSDVD
jgi:hypothetical protein